MFNELFFWLIFAVFASIIIFVDLYLTDHKPGKVGLKRSLTWSGVWITTALLFNVLIYFYLNDGHQKAIEFLTGYLVEYSLSVDNLFVFLMIFSVMNIPPNSQPHVLKWGILSAIVFRIIFIIAGVGLINLFHPIIYFFGLILIFAAYKMAFSKEKKIDYEKNPLIKLIKKYFNILDDYKEKKFFIKRNGKVFVTSLFLTLLLIESSDIIFAIDSIPAVIAITRDPFIIITSNIFAIIGLRSLYFALSGIVGMFYFLKYGVACILVFVGAKMILSEIINISTIFSLEIIASFLILSVTLSLFYKNKSSLKIHKDE